MTLDSSVLVAVIFSEPGFLQLVDLMLEADTIRVGAPTLAEASLVVTGRRRKASDRDLEELVRELGVTVVSFGEEEWRAAAAAFQRYGRGRHRASLNFGDCLAYATASVASDTLLFVGDDFSQTDITPARA